MHRHFHFPTSVVLSLVAVVTLMGLVWTGCTDTPEQVTAPAPKFDAMVSHGQALDDLSPRVQAVMDVQNRHTRELLAVPDVVGTGTGLTDDGRLALLILTRSRTTLRKVPRSLDGVPTQVRVVGDVRPMGYKGTYRPVPPE